MYTLKLEDFDYEINGDNLIFKKIANDKEKHIKLLDKYNIKGKDYIVNEIDKFAFKFSYIENIILPDTIEKIGNAAFSYSKIESFIIPPKVKKIPDCCFLECQNLKDIIFHNDIKKIGFESFSNTKIEKFVCPPKVTEIPEGCFCGCKNLKEVVLHDNIVKINSSSFKFSGIEKFVCPTKVTEIPFGCFEGCENLTDVVLHEDIKKLEMEAFCNSGIKEFMYLPKIKKIPLYCFFGCKNLKYIDLKNINLIKKNAFNLSVSGNDLNNLSYQNNKDIYIDDYKELINKGFFDGQINQILKGYEKFIYLNNLPISTSIDVFRTIINNFNKYPEQFSDIIKQLENKDIDLNDKLELYDEINKLSSDKNLDNKDIEHTI